MTIWTRLNHIDKRIIYTILIVSLVIPLLNPLNIPISVSPNTQSTYDFIDNLAAGSKVLLAVDMAPNSAAETYSSLVAVTEHLIRKECKIYIFSIWETGPMFGQRAVVDAHPELEYGVDVVNLGFLSGGETATKYFSEDILAAVPRDYLGNTTSALPMMENVTTAKSFDMIVEFSSGSPGVREWIRQVITPMGIPFAAATNANVAPEYAVYVQSGQLVGLLPGLRGSAEYETLIERPAAATSKMDAQSIAHLLIIVLIVIGNIGYLMEKRQNTKDDTKAVSA